MDSFYDFPREPPKPYSREEEVLQRPTLPENSLLLDVVPQTARRTKDYRAAPPTHLCYDMWKQRHFGRPTSQPPAKENTPPKLDKPPPTSSASFLRKQVRFESPVLQPSNSGDFPPRSPSNSTMKCGGVTPNTKEKPSRKFQDLYMANLPNRQLDLSIIEPARVVQPRVATVATPKRSEKERFTNYNDEQIYDVMNYKCSPELLSNRRRIAEPANRAKEKTTSPVVPNVTEANIREDRVVEKASANGNDSSTVQGLLKIIQQQNEQMLILQRQVATLLENQSKIQQQQLKAIENDQENPGTTQQCDNYREAPLTVFDTDFRKAQKHMPNKFAIDVMTSFEVSIRPPQQQNKQQLATITDVTDAVADRDMCYMPAVEVPDTSRLSPEPSIHVDMQDYSSDSDTNESMQSSSDIGWTIYNNVMGQVNNILTKTKVGKIDKTCEQPTTRDKLRNKTLNQVKEATLKHLQSIGVSVSPEKLYDSVNTETTTDGIDYTPTEVSFAVKQLLMKYLPTEHLAKLSKQPSNARQVQIATKSAEQLIPRRPDFSFATIQYMKKYNLMANTNSNGELRAMVEPAATKKHRNAALASAPVQQRGGSGQKVLDITALKQQPKLL